MTTFGDPATTDRHFYYAYRLWRRTPDGLGATLGLIDSFNRMRRSFGLPIFEDPGVDSWEDDGGRPR